jgi:hypothetical protein
LVGLDYFGLIVGLCIAAGFVVCLHWWFLVVVPGRGPLAEGGSLDRLTNRLVVGDPLDFLRKRQTRGLEVGVSKQELHRGGHAEALVTISSAGLGNLEVSLVCTEIYVVARGRRRRRLDAQARREVSFLP